MRVSCDKSKRMMRRFNDYVRGEMKRQKIKQDDLGEYLRVSGAAIAMKLNGTNAWTLEQAFNAVEFLDGDFTDIFK